MKKRKIFEQQTIDVTTGEIIKDVKQFVTGNEETFFMGRTTEGLEWTKNIKTVTDIQLLFLMLQYQERKSKLIIFTSLQIEEAATFLEVSTRTIRTAIKNLIENDFIVKVKANNYLSNPYCFYIGRSDEVIIKYKLYLSIKHGNDKSENFEKEGKSLKIK